MLKKIVALICFSFFLSTAQEKNISFGLNPSLGLTYTNTSKSENDKENFEWLFNLQSNFNYQSKDFHFDSDLFINFGQAVKSNAYPEKTQDALILNLMPSIKICDTPSVRLFLQSKVETQMKKGYIDSQETHFLDPLFLTQTIFIGEKKYLIGTPEEHTLNLTYGIGYSFQQIIKQNFTLTSENMPSSDAEFINGPSVVLKINFSKQLGEDFLISASLNSLFLMKNNFFKHISNFRFSSLILGSIDFRFISIQYTNRLVYDKELSNKRQLDQSLVLGVKYSW